MSTGVTERAWSLSVPHHARGAAIARRHLLAALDEAGMAGDVVTDAVSVVSELVGNAVRHARAWRPGVIAVAWSVQPERVQIRVIDGGSGSVPRLSTPPLDAMHGRGLQIVAALADRWGVEPVSGGRCVWAELSR